MWTRVMTLLSKLTPDEIMMRKAAVALLLVALSTSVTAQRSTPEMQKFVTADAPVFALTHVRLIDGTGAPAREDQTVVVVDGNIQWIGPATDAPVPASAKILDYRGHSVIPGLVGIEQVIFPTLASAEQLVSEKKIVAGGPALGRVVQLARNSA